MDRRSFVRLGAWSAPALVSVRLGQSLGSGVPRDPSSSSDPFVPRAAVPDPKDPPVPGSGRPIPAARGTLPLTGAAIGEVAAVGAAAVVVGAVGVAVSGREAGQ